MKLQLKIFIFLGFCFALTRDASALIVINEFLADPASGLAGDANRDGVRNASDDEFVELFNTGPLDKNLSDWSLWDSAALRHKFPQGTLVGPSQRVVVFGGGIPQGIPGLVQTASSFSLNLNNTGDTIALKDPQNLIASQIMFGSEGNQNQSLTRWPEGNGIFQLHSQTSLAGKLFSPGTGPNGEIYAPTSMIVPEPASWALMFMGFLLKPIFRHRSV